MAKVLVVGGAGYVGGSTCAWLRDHGHEVWVLDDLSRGHREFLLGGRFIHARAGDRHAVLGLLKSERFDCVMHFAAFALVGESVAKPEMYFENNVEQTRLLLDAMLDAGTRRFVFSSTCAVFGDPTPHLGSSGLMHEGLPQSPINPYGQTKLEVERLLGSLAKKRGLQSVALRYFNASGGEPRLRLGEWHEPETHLIPNVLRAALSGRPVEIFGTDYPTSDGTCVRDYIHVWDLAAAHGAAMDRLLSRSSEVGGCFEAFNLGSQSGFSVREVIETARKITGKEIRTVEKPRRPGDPPRLVADSAAARKELGFKLEYSSLGEIIRTAWEWELKLDQGVTKAVFLDRDGTINHDPGYLSRPDQMVLFPGVGESMARLRDAGFLLIVVSNQSGVGRGLIDPQGLSAIHARLDELLSPHGVRVDHFELCVHRPEENCDCRKPKPKLLTEAARTRRVNLSKSYMVGDKRSDLLAGRAAGCRGVALVRTGEGSVQESSLAPGESDFNGDSLAEVERWILDRENADL